jgi:hypothetical protein
VRDHSSALAEEGGACCSVFSYTTHSMHKIEFGYFCWFSFYLTGILWRVKGTSVELDNDLGGKRLVSGCGYSPPRKCPIGSAPDQTTPAENEGAG